jgi:PAS domain S-box-containing protein
VDPTLTSTEYRLLTEHSPVMIWRAGLDSNCDYFNETWLSFTGRTLQQEMGPGWAEGIHADDFERCLSFYLDHFKRRDAFEMEYRLRRHDGEYRWILDRGVPFTDDSSTFAGFIGSCVDVHERRKAQEAEVQRNEEQLAYARDFQKSILAIVSHDIRNPLHAIQLAAKALRTGADPGSSVKKQADVVTRGVDRIQHIVGDLLDLSRAREGGGIPVRPKPIDIRAVCQQVIEELDSLTPARITLECETDSHGSWDEHRILQAISNLASNALKHGTSGSPVSIHITGDDNRIAVDVHNEGTIPSEVLPRIFEPFRSVSANPHRGDGLGLGLFIARTIARAHGGALEFVSAHGATMFRLVLPRHTPS